MKKIVLVCLFVSMVALSNASPHDVEAPNPRLLIEPSGDILQIVSFPAMTQQMFEDFFNGKLPHLIVEYPQGVTMSLGLNMSGDFLALEASEESDMRVTLTRTFYVQCFGGDKIYFSIDTKNWKEFCEFFTGSVGVSFVSGDEHSNISRIILNHEFNERLSEE